MAELTQSNFLNGYRTLAEVEFDGSQQASEAKAVIDEMKFTSIMNAEACVMEANGLFEHKAYRDNEVDKGAENVALDEGYKVTGVTQMSEFSVSMGRIIESKEFASNQTRYNKAAEAEKRARDIKKAIDGINRKDAKTLIYGGTTGDGREFNHKEYDGLASFANSKTDLGAFWTAIHNDNCPFTHDHQCITIDVRDFVVTSATAGTPDVGVKGTDGKLGSIFSVVWSPEYVSKLYPKGDTVSYGINMKTVYDQYVEYIDSTPSVGGAVTRHFYRDVIDLEKFTGLWVGNRFGIIRLANINLDPTQTESQWRAQLAAVEAAAAEAMRIQDHAGIANMASWYGCGALVNKFKQLRSNKMTFVMGVSGQGQPQNISMQTPFYLLDSVALKNENTLSQFEKLV